MLQKVILLLILFLSVTSQSATYPIPMSPRIYNGITLSAEGYLSRREFTLQDISYSDFNFETLQHDKIDTLNYPGISYWDRTTTFSVGIHSRVMISTSLIPQRTSLNFKLNLFDRGNYRQRQLYKALSKQCLCNLHWR